MLTDRKRRLTAFMVAIAVLIATPLVVMAADAFDDVPNSNVHHDDITWLKEAGVTVGCNPPANTEFCPGDPVLRQQMASFMRRLAENEVVNAATAKEADHAANADTLDGLEASVFAARPMLTTLRSTGQTTDDSVTTTYELFKPLGSFEKQDEDTVLIITFTGHVSGVLPVAGDFCDFQLRVDGNPESTASSSTGRIVLYAADAPASVTAVFESVPAGSHALELWLRGIATSCTVNRGNFSMTALIEEVFPSENSSLPTQSSSGDQVDNGITD